MHRRVDINKDIPAKNLVFMLDSGVNRLVVIKEHRADTHLAPRCCQQSTCYLTASQDTSSGISTWESPSHVVITATLCPLHKYLFSFQVLSTVDVLLYSFPTRFWSIIKFEEGF